MSSLQLRIVVCDHYMTKPTAGLDVTYSEFRGTDIKQVPVLRIFGPAKDGYKACLHIHGVFPYFYIPCPTQNPEPQLLYQIAASLDKALNIAMKQATSSNQHVYKISLVKGLPFYGYHDKEHLYLKVFLYSPGLIKQAVELFSSGAILGQTFQPHESHLNFTLQFFIDFNLFGMSDIDLQSVQFRKSGFSQKSNEVLFDTKENTLTSESSCHYEADCMASHIINRQRIGKGDGIENPGLEEVWNQELERRKQLNMSLASKSLSQGLTSLKQVETDSHYKFENIFAVKLSNKIDKPVLLEHAYYPAETLGDTQLFKAVDVSIHLPSKDLDLTLNRTTKMNLNEHEEEDLDTTIVDENLVLNSSMSLQYSQVLLNSEDMELIDMLHDMDQQRVEEDSIMGTPANRDQEVDMELDDAEYSRIFNDDSVCHDQNESENNGSPLSWHDSFWDGANIPQLDGTFDNDHVTKVRKKRRRTLQLGLSRPKKKNERVNNPTNTDSNIDTSEIDEINVSRETADGDVCISELVRASKISKTSIENTEIKSEETFIDAVSRITAKQNIVKLMNKSEIYDLQNKFVPTAGPSNKPVDCDNTEMGNSSNNELELSPDGNELGIVSFYDASKVFDDSFNQTFLQEQTNCDDCSDIIANEYEKQEDYDKFKDTELKLDVSVNEKLDTGIKIFTPTVKPPTKNEMETKYKIPKTKQVQPFFSDYKDVGDKVEIGQLVLKLHSNLSRDQKPFEKVLETESIENWRQLLFLQKYATQDDYKPDTLRTLLAGNSRYVIQPVVRPPTSEQVKKWINEQKALQLLSQFSSEQAISKNMDDFNNSQALGLNEDEINSSIVSIENCESGKPDNSFQITLNTDGSFLCFGNTDICKDNNSCEVATVNADFLTSMVIEVHTSVRGDMHPDPAVDPIKAVFYSVINDCPNNHFLKKSLTGIIVVDSSSRKYLDGCVFNVPVIYVSNEIETIDEVIKLVNIHDPDIMCGYEIEMNSWGYVLERAEILGLDVLKDLSRITEKNRQKRWMKNESDYEGRIIGRVIFNVWRLFRHELALSSYSFENCMYEVLNERVPSYSYAQLSDWWCDESKMLRWIPVEYYLTKLSGTVRMLQKLDIINRTSELARLFGLQWWEVLSRGSQFRVESLMLRAARPLNLIALSPTIKQRSTMRAPETLPLIFEPESRFYSDPVIVLDFQSLYPSMMIAYNYCFSTCIGRVQNINGETAYEFGAWRLRIPRSKLEALVKNSLIHWSPVGIGFVKTSVRRGVLPALLRRILAARQAVKKSMKMQNDEAVKKAMHSRQLGLKLIANVTYGYTAANFSGRMPCVEVADSVVAKGRETLERAIKLVRENTTWNAKVIYGDTDSMFVLVPGRSRLEAFEIGQQIADAVTADNPPPVALKLEKVYQPCILQTKKRYVGFMFESPDQEKPTYEAKGIETVRRDGCPAGVKLLRQSLCELFTHGDMSVVKRLVKATLSRLAETSLPVHELFFTREYHGQAGYRPGASAPPNEIAKRIGMKDRRAIPRTGWRVSWLVTCGAPGVPLVRLARTPQELTRDRSLRPHVAYYATRVLLPPLHRCLSLLGVDVFKWWNELGYNRTAQQREQTQSGGIEKYMSRERCAVCGVRTIVRSAVCPQCAHTQRACVVLQTRANNAATYLDSCYSICSSCCGHTDTEKCQNVECPVLWRRSSACERYSQMTELLTHLP
uniref:DNA polymerase n=1 Tax=Bombyx mori TaxID=7091 RepID=A0A8R2GB14_BOMMO|nr:DNA polymerase zeta catalytic subunit isoform X2 [Bombyx mori]